ncbi:MAG TPA: arginase family protein [Ohtaekwangia sp.]|nr:arginase family protein [Ohtaekwangia sp.]
MRPEGKNRFVARSLLYDSRRDGTTQMLNESTLVGFSQLLYETTLDTLSTGKFPLVLGGDCSIIIGIMAALKARGTFGLIFIDAHADFYLPEQSVTGEAADMDLAIVMGRGVASLTNLNNLKPYAAERNVFHVGQRDQEEARRYGSADIKDTGIRCYNCGQINDQGIRAVTAAIIRQANDLRLDGYWLHFDTDVLADDVNPAVDYRLPGGLSFEQCTFLLEQLLGAVNVTGLSVTIFNPLRDDKGTIAGRITECIASALKVRG